LELLRPGVTNMQSIFGLNQRTPKASPFEGIPSVRAQRAEEDLRHLSRSEWWLWFSACLVTVLSGVAFSLTAFPSYFRHNEHFYELRSEQVRWGVLCLVLLFNAWLLYRQWSLRRERRQLSGASAAPEARAAQISDSFSASVDSVTGLYTRGFIEQQLGKEIARAKRQNTALSLATIHLDEFGDAVRRHGESATDQALKELARRLKKSCRNCDFAVRLANDDFLLVLPECGLGEVKLVLNRLGALEMNYSGQQMNLTYTTGWVDYQAGDTPTDLIRRASEILHLYENAAKESLASTLAPH
jgi:diguanylate cyclase (GGDEF)-like protein